MNIFRSYENSLGKCKLLKSRSQGDNFGKYSLLCATRLVMVALYSDSVTHTLSSSRKSLQARLIDLSAEVPKAP